MKYLKQHWWNSVFIYVLIAGFGFGICDFMEHRRRKYGKIKDAACKTHPMTVELPQAEKQKDFDIVENIITLMRSIGLRSLQNNIATVK